MNPKSNKTHEIRAKVQLPSEVVHVEVFVRGQDGQLRRAFGSAKFHFDDLIDVIDALRRLRLVQPGELSPAGQSMLVQLWALWDEAPGLDAAWEEAPWAVRDRFIAEVLFDMDELIEQPPS